MINKLRKISLFLFLIPAIALFLSLMFSNFLVSFNFSDKAFNFERELNLNSIFKSECNKNNNFCLFVQKKNNQLNKCSKYEFKNYYLINGTKYIIEVNTVTDFYNTYNNKEEFIKKFFSNSFMTQENYSNLKITRIYEATENLNKTCINSYPIYSKFYNFFPYPLIFINDTRESHKYNPGVSSAVFPFIYGEASISNIVKRYPINYIFKPLLFIGSILMILYWINYQRIINKITNKEKIYKFTVFGISSSIFLFLHVVFLGTEIDNNIFNKLRKLILLLFIICEILAQFYLTRRLFYLRNNLDKFIKNFILKLKIIFITIVIMVTVVVLITLSFFNLESKVDYILEWNYFLYLLFFYFLSFKIWKKQ